MKTIYLDKNFMCHTVNEGGMVEHQTEAFDTLSNNAIPFFRLVPKGQRWNGVICGYDLVENTNPTMVNAIMKEYREGEIRLNNALKEIAEAMGINTEYVEED